MKLFALVPLVLLAFATSAFGQQPGPGWPYPALTTVAAQEPVPVPPLAEVPRPQPGSGGFPTYAPERLAPLEELPPPPRAEGQQHWVSLNLSVLQPFAGRLGVKVWSRPNNSVWLEVSLGSVLFDFMVGLGVRVQHTKRAFGSGDRLMVSPGLGVHVLPSYSSGRGFLGGPSHDSGVTFLVADVDLSWLHDFGPHFGFEMGVKLGLGLKVAGQTGRYPRGVMFGRDLYPILALYSGFRF